MPVAAAAKISELLVVAQCGLGLHDKSGAFLRDHYGRRIGVARGNGRHDGSVNNPKTIDAMHPQTVVDNRLGVRAHLAGTDSVKNSGAKIGSSIIFIRELGLAGSLGFLIDIL